MRVLLLLVIFATTSLAKFSQECLQSIQGMDRNQSAPYQAIDSWGKPVGISRGSFTSLGSWKACRQIKGFHHLTLEGSLHVTAELSLQSLLGICMLQECANEGDVRAFFKQIMVEINRLLAGGDRNEEMPILLQLAVQSMYGSVGNAKLGTVVYYKINQVRVTVDKQPWTAGALAMICVWALLITLTISATAVEYFEKRQFNRASSTLKATATVTVTGDDDETAPMLPSSTKSEAAAAKSHSRTSRRSLGRRILGSFSLYTTLPAMFSAESRRYGELQILNGIRVISIWWVVLGHSFGLIMESASVDSVDNLQLLEQSSSMILVNAFFSVDTFFYLSSFLVAYMLFADETARRRFTYGKYFLLRYLRLTPAFAMVLFSWWFLFPLSASGPLWYQATDPINEACPKYWWTHLLYINNFYPQVIRRECIPWGWYLAADYHLYMLAPLFIFSLTRFRGKNRQWIGYAIVACGFIIQAVVTAIPAILFNVPDVPTPVKSALVDQNSLGDTVDEWHRVFYENSYNHISVMLVGILGAFVAVGLRQRREEQIASSARQRRRNQLLILTLHLMGALLLLLTIYLPFNHVRDYSRWPVAANAAYLFFSRISWAVGISLLIIPTIVDPRQTTLMSALFEWKPWAILGRLTYCVYMVHILVMRWLLDTRQREDSFTPSLAIINFGGVLWWSYLVGGLVFLLAEQPAAQLLKILIGR